MEGGEAGSWEGWEIFKVPLNSWQRGPNPLFYEDPVILSILLSQILFNNSIHFRVTSNPHPHYSFCPSVFWLNGWSWHIWCAILFNDNLDLYLSGLGTRRTLIWVLCNNTSGLVWWYGFSRVLWFDITHT